MRQMPLNQLISKPRSSDSLDSLFEQEMVEFLKQRIGMQVQDHQLPALRKTVNAALLRFDYPLCNDFLQALRAQQSPSPEFEFVVAGLTVGESYFFRDSHQFAFLEEVFLPELICRKRKQHDLTLRIWSAGCSDGQEIASIAILLRRLLADIDTWDLHLLGTDINSMALARAMDGVYRKWSMRSVPDTVVRANFRLGNQQYTLLPEIKKNIRYAQLNLTEERFPSILTDTAMLDLIMCRNVFIYMEEKVIGKIIERFEAGLADNGVLMLGASDPHGQASGRLKQFHTNGAYYYKRRPGESKPAGKAKSSFSTRLVVKKQVKDYKTRPQAVSAKIAASSYNAVDILHKISKLELDNRWQEVLDLIQAWVANGLDEPAVARRHAMVLANLGKLENAGQVCSGILARDPEDCYAYFIQALILTEQNDEAGATQALRRALYIDRGFLEAHRQLGLLLLRRGHRKRGMLELKAAMKLAQQEDPARLLMFMPGISCERFMQILETEIDLYLQSNGAG